MSTFDKDNTAAAADCAAAVDASVKIMHPVPSEVISPYMMRERMSEACTATNTRTASNSSSAKSISYVFRVGEPEDTEKMLALWRKMNTAIGNDEDHAGLSELSETLLRDRKDNLYYTVLVECDNEILAYAIVYWAYSTWDGRFLYINRILVDDSAGDCCDAAALETSLLYTLADAAVKLEGQRLVWQHYHEKSPLYKNLQAESLDGWLTLRMSTQAMDSFLEANQLSCVIPSITDSYTNHNDNDDSIIRKALFQSNSNSRKVDSHSSNTTPSLFELHLATSPTDLPHMERLVNGLAIYEKEPESIFVNAEHYGMDGFPKNNNDHSNNDQRGTPLFKCLLLKSNKKNEGTDENNSDDTGVICGMALFYFGYDLAKGRFLYLEDLYIEEAYRGAGGGSVLMSTLALIAKSTKCTGGFVWQALDWNTPALTFYGKIGAKVVDGLLTTRYSGENLKEFTKNRPVHI